MLFLTPSPHPPSLRFWFFAEFSFSDEKGVFDLSITHNSWNSLRAEGGKFLNFSLPLLSTSSEFWRFSCPLVSPDVFTSPSF